jgi:hypothetical protein
MFFFVEYLSEDEIYALLGYYATDLINIAAEA